MLNLIELKNRIEFAYNSEELKQEYSEECFESRNYYVEVRVNLESGELYVKKYYQGNRKLTYRDLVLITSQCCDYFDDFIPEYYLTDVQYNDMQEIESEDEERIKEEMKEEFIKKYGFDYEEHCSKCEREAIIAEYYDMYEYEFQDYNDNQLQKALDIYEKYGEKFNIYCDYLEPQFDENLNEIELVY
jgi:hypothetical protein